MPNGRRNPLDYARALDDRCTKYGSRAVDYGVAVAEVGVAAPATQPTKTYSLPDPETFYTQNKARYPRVSKLPLYEKPPDYDQVLQRGIPNCYLAATLAAMANTNDGRGQIAQMIRLQKGAVITICKKYDSQGVQPEERLQSDRWFTVAFKRKSVEVSDVLYHNDSDSSPNLVYMTTPYPDKALWGAIIEVAYAKLKGGYDNISASTDTAAVNSFLDEFSAVKWDILDPANDKAIKERCKSAGKRAVFIATRSTNTKILTPWHGYAVLGMEGTTVKLWDPLEGKSEMIEFKDLLAEVQGVISAT